MTPLSTEQLAALATLRRLQGVRELCMVGAAAVAVQAPSLLRRTTQDVDIAVLCGVQGDALDSELKVAGWRQDKAVEHRWHTPGGAELDILVFSALDLEHGSVSTGGDREMGLIGFDLAMQHAVDVDLGEVAGVWGVAPLHVIALLPN